MPADYLIDAEREVVCSRGTGVFTQADYLAQMEQLGQDTLFRPGFDHLVDCRAITLMDLTAGQIEELARQSIFNAQSRRAIVVANGVQFGLGRMHGTYREFHARQQVMVFTELSEALIWLGLPGDLDPFAKKVTPADSKTE